MEQDTLRPARRNDILDIFITDKEDLMHLSDKVNWLFMVLNVQMISTLSKGLKQYPIWISINNWKSIRKEIHRQKWSNILRTQEFLTWNAFSLCQQCNLYAWHKFRTNGQHSENKITQGFKIFMGYSLKASKRQLKDRKKSIFIWKLWEIEYKIKFSHENKKKREKAKTWKAQNNH